MRKASLAFWSIVIVLPIAFLWLTRPIIIRSHRDSDLTSATFNARSIGLAMWTFETEYGRFPDDSTAPKIREQHHCSHALAGRYSNDYLRQLLAAGAADSETIFHSLTSYTQKPDNRFDKPRNALAAGEVGFGYVMTTGGSVDPQGSPGRVLACTPLAYRNGDVSTQRFDASIHDGWAIILKLDNSVISTAIHEETGEVLLGNKPLLASGADTVWGDDEVPVLIPPLPRP